MGLLFKFISVFPCVGFVRLVNIDFGRLRLGNIHDRVVKSSWWKFVDANEEIGCGAVFANIYIYIAKISICSELSIVIKSIIKSHEAIKRFPSLFAAQTLKR